MKRVVSLALAVVLLAALFTGCAGKTGKVTVQVERDGQVTLTKEYEFALPADDSQSVSVESIVEEHAEELGATLVDSDYGKYVTGMDGYVADDAKQEYWSFLVNGEMSQTGLRDTKAADGDVYTFQLATY